MSDQKNQKIVVRFQRGKMFLNANVALNTRRLLLYTLIVCLVVLLIASSLNEEFRKYLIEILIGILQSVVANNLSIKSTK
jgi:hypothetical protein